MAASSRPTKALWGLPFLAMSIAAFTLMDASTSMPWAEEIIKEGVVEQAARVPIRTTFYGIEGLDGFLTTVNTFFFSSLYSFDFVSRRQIISFLVDVGPLTAVWLLEASRKANGFSIIKMPSLFLLLAQALGGGVVVPFFFFLLYVFSPTERYARDGRAVPLNIVRAILPAVLLGHIVPFGLAFFHIDMASRQTYLFVWQLYPLYIAAVRLVVSSVLGTHAGTRDLPSMRVTVGTLVALSSVIWITNLATTPYSLAHIFLPSGNPQTTTNMVDFARLFLQWDELFIFASSFLWLAYQIGDLKRDGATQVGWLAVVAAAGAGLLALGPGATFGLGWLWREGVLVSRKGKGQ